ncbi:amino acid adenylation protein [Streptomyces spiroverticillatus]|uniref:Amino acid adenylation protein n=1 Tax=Streptomyces finlayi TaxID=67296 RepID=A0A919CAC3_9ACTN|nr:non-ribosomal peptide synthetase [Streptomyces finlayi]GHA11492.1 amino acid adenylation protein [Streptomyces spiroverticillatus]GHC94976.1 amino acid adenylation protein [Streptomyces finlayi]
MSDTSAFPEADTTADALAAVVGAWYRRTLQERVIVGCRVADEGRTLAGQAVFDLDAEHTHQELLGQATKALGDLADAGVGSCGGESGDIGESVVRFSAGAGRDVTGAHTVPLVELGADTSIVVTAPDDPAWDEREAAAYAALVRSVRTAGRAAPDAPIARLVLPADEGPAFWGTPQAPIEAARIDDLIAGHAASDPEAVAVSCAGQSLTRAELDACATALAARLQFHGVGPDSVVAVLMHRSVDLIVALVAVLKAGGAYLALNPDDPAARLADLTRDAGVEVALAQGDLAGLVPAGITVVGPAEPLDQAPAWTPPTGLTPDHLAYVCYTSGSTGEPKGVGVPHRAVARLVRGTDWVDIRPDDVFLHLSPVSFDAATFEIFGALVNGCRLAVLPGGRMEMDRLAATVQDERVSVLLLPTGLLHATVSSTIDAFTGVRHVLTGGDVASAEHVRRLFEAHPDVRFTNGYGPTENTTYTTCWTTDTPPASASVSIGGPISGTSVAILDEDLNPVPTGVAGELYAAGEGLAVGYLGKPGATAARFVPHPFPSRPGERTYRTGDLARRRADGGVEFIGRADQQVKVQGYRVELGAVEDALTRSPDVAVAAVAAQREPQGGKRLIAYVVPADPQADTAELVAGLRKRLGAELPAYMVPWAVLVLPGLALNRNGKVDRRALPAVTRQPRDMWNEYVAPTTDLERRLTDLWGQLLGIEPIGVEDDFFDLGGHSLMAAELLAVLQSDLGLDVSARTLYLQPTIAELCADIEQSAGPSD